MEEDTSIKINKIYKKLMKVTIGTISLFLILILALISYYFIMTKISNSKGEKSSLLLYTMVSDNMKPKLEKDDLLFIKRTNTFKVNDIISYKSANMLLGTTPIIKKIKNINSDTITVIDNDNSEEEIQKSNIIGKVILKIPNFGKVRFLFTSKYSILLVVSIPLSIMLIYDIYKIVKIILLKKRLSGLEDIIN